MPEAVDFSNPSLLYALAWTLIEQKERQRFRIFSQEFTREQCLYEIYRHLPSYLPDLKIKDFHELDDEKLLKAFAESVLATIRAAQPEASGPTALQLKALVDEYQAHLQNLAQQEELRSGLILDQLSLENQLKLITRYREYQKQIKEGVKQNISAFYSEEFKDQAAEEVTERLFQEIASQVRAVAPTDETFVKVAVAKIFQESPEADLAFSAKEKKSLTGLFIKTIAPMDTKKLVEGYLACENLIQASLPKREPVIKKIGAVASLVPDAAREVLNKAETLRLASRQPTEFQVKEVLRQVGIPEARINPLVPYIKNYLIANPIAQAQGQPHPAFISRYALKISRKLSLAPTTAQDALDGLSVSLLEQLQKRPGISEAQKQLFEERVENLKNLEMVLTKTRGFRSLKLKIAWNQKKTQILNLFDENNPLSPVFYRIHFPDLRSKYLERRKYHQATWQYLKTTSPLRFFFAPRQQVRTFVGGWWNGVLARSKTLSRFADFLPKLKPSYWLGRGLGGFLVRKGAAWAAETGIKAFAGRALGFIGSKLLGKAAGSLIGTAIGGPVGAVVGFVGGMVLGKVLDKGKKWLKRGLAIAGATAGLLFAKLLGFLFAGGITTLFTLAGAGIGFLVGGPVGALFGAGTGAGLGHLFSGLFGKGAGVQAASSAVSGANALLSAPASATVSGPIAAAPIIAIGATAVLTVTTATIKGGAFIPKEIGGGIDAPKNVVVTPDCEHAACKIIAQLKSCGISRITKNNFSRVKDCLSGFPKALSEFEHSVKNVSDNLQCVGFKVGVEKEEGINLPRLNAVSYLYDSGCDEVSSSNPEVGDNAVWGPRKACPTQDPKEANQLCESNIYCCGHIGVITEVGDYLDKEEKYRQITVTQAWGNNGQVNSITISTNPQAGGPWKIISCDD